MTACSLARFDFEVRALASHRHCTKSTRAEPLQLWLLGIGFVPSAQKAIKHRSMASLSSDLPPWIYSMKREKFMLDRILPLFSEIPLGEGLPMVSSLWLAEQEATHAQEEKPPKPTNYPTNNFIYTTQRNLLERAFQFLYRPSWDTHDKQGCLRLLSF